MRKRPEVTRVEEWTKAEIGVGAAIAKGNQGEKGKMADLVINVKIKNTIRTRGDNLEDIEKKSG